MLISAPAAYVISRLPRAWRYSTILALLFTQMFPDVGIAMPVAITFLRLGLNDTDLGLILAHLVPTLPVGPALGRQMLGPGNVEFVVEDRVARRILVHVGGAMADPLPGDEDRQFHMVFDLAHLERRGVAVPHQIVDQAAILADLLGAAAVGHARGLHHGGIVAHVIDHAHEAMVEHRQEFQRELEAIEAKVVELFTMVAEDLPGATRALLSGDHEVVRVLAEREEVIDALYPEIEELVLPSKSGVERLYWEGRETDYGDKRRVA